MPGDHVEPPRCQLGHGRFEMERRRLDRSERQIGAVSRRYVEGSRNAIDHRPDRNQSHRFGSASKCCVVPRSPRNAHTVRIRRTGRMPDLRVLGRAVPVQRHNRVSVQHRSREQPGSNVKAAQALWRRRPSNESRAPSTREARSKHPSVDWRCSRPRPNVDQSALRTRRQSIRMQRPDRGPSPSNSARGHRMEHALGAELLRLSITDRALDHRVRRVAVLRFGHGFEAFARNCAADSSPTPTPLAAVKATPSPRPSRISARSRHRSVVRNAPETTRGPPPVS